MGNAATDEYLATYPAHQRYKKGETNWTDDGHTWSQNTDKSNSYPTHSTCYQVSATDPVLPGKGSKFNITQ